MRVIGIKNPELSEQKRTYLTVAYTTGTTLTVASSTGFANNDLVVIGVVGRELTDLTATPPSDTTMTVTALKYDHPKDSPVSLSHWDQYNLDYRTSSSGTWTTLVSLANLEWDTDYTEYKHSAGLSTYEYRVRYYNTQTVGYSDYSDTITGAGWDREAAGHMIENVRKMTNDPEGQLVEDEMIFRFFNEAQDKVRAVLKRPYFLLTEVDGSTSSSYRTVASKKNYDLPPNFDRMESLRYRYWTTTSTSSSTSTSTSTT